MIKPVRSTETCRCPAYTFPHRFGGGTCSGAQVICSSCANECREVKVDFGVGPYEYGSDHGVHTDIHMASDCCEVDVYKISEDGSPTWSF